MKLTTKQFICAASIGLALFTGTLQAADHGDAPNLAPDQGADIGDLYAFLDPGDNTQVILIGTTRGFIVPGEANNFGIFDEDVRYSFHIENSGDSTPDFFIDVNFNQVLRPVIDSKGRKAGDTGFLPPDVTGFKGVPRGAQNAIISFRGKAPTDLVGAKGKSHAPVTQPTTADVANAQVITSLANAKNEPLNISFFAGMADDPFFFDIPAFGRFISSVLGGTTVLTHFDRARDSFAGYNTMSIAIRIPAAKLLSTKVGAPSKIGVSFSTARKSQKPVKGNQVGVGGYFQVDRAGVPGINVALLPFNGKNAYNGGTTIDDGKGTFFGQIAGTLIALGTSNTLGNTEPTALSVLASVAGLPPGLTVPIPKNGVLGTGDYLRLETNATTAPNTGMGGGDNTGSGFPNGRRLKDDVIDTIIYFVTNGAYTLGDKVNASDIAPINSFPFVALPQQPRTNGILDDNTRN